MNFFYNLGPWGRFFKVNDVDVKIKLEYFINTVFLLEICKKLLIFFSTTNKISFLAYIVGISHQVDILTISLD